MNRSRSFSRIGASLTCVVALTSGLLVAGSPAGTASTPTYGPSSSGDTVKVRQDARIRIFLPSNASTGYRWVIRSGADSAVFDIKARREVGPKNPMPGAGGRTVFVIEGDDVGRDTFVAVYRGPGRNPDIAKRYRLTIRVTD
ncbi:protease inhibitor I42 family protein [Nocardioides sp. R-C-SC26]|uniref:protease inhibitor I42 family protein n=1 Tax=Nocardioides sp. R-C-SC26 TaxID=2870414 RepID=UPI001E3115CA|nr:protease inhibitor I42 family protein [Nocardioides sp. R-C-SC26]